MSKAKITRKSQMKLKEAMSDIRKLVGKYYGLEYRDNLLLKKTLLLIEELESRINWFENENILLINIIFV